ncbi:MAG: hypothetical protein IJH04_00845 [Eggerthellaceae bacterium]|nr:hypothetical protein [Eggerthellaceae bacterium]
MDDKQWERIRQYLAADAQGKTLRPLVSQRTLFGIKSTMEQQIQAIVEEDEAKHRAQRMQNNEQDNRPSQD